MYGYVYDVKYRIFRMGGSYFTFSATDFGILSASRGSYFIFTSVGFGVWKVLGGLSSALFGRYQVDIGKRSALGGVGNMDSYQLTMDIRKTPNASP